MKSKHARAAFDGEGARLYGGRWNSVGTPMVYLAESRSLALLEILVHLQSQSALRSYIRFRVEYERARCELLDPAMLPDNWRDSPAPLHLQTIGDAWAAAGHSLALSVPCVLVPEERLILLNPRHPGFPKIRIDAHEPVRLDPRLG